MRVTINNESTTAEPLPKNGHLNEKILDSKAGPRVCPKLPNFCPDYFSLTTEEIVLIVFDIIDIDI